MSFQKEKLKMIFGRPTLRQPGGDERKASWLELYFDLFFVAAISIISHTFAHEIAHHRSRGLLMQLIIQVTAIWRIWSSITYFFERFATVGLTKRVYFFLTMFVVGGMAMSLQDGLQTMGVRFFGLYGLSKLMLGLMFLWGLKSIPTHLRETDTINAWTNISVFFLAIIGMFVMPEWRVGLFVLSLAMDVLVPLVHHQTSRELPTAATDKFNERFGLFVIIVLGEAIVAVVSGIDVSAISREVLWAGAGALTLNFFHRWLYFDFVSRSHMREETAYAYAYIHLPLVICYTIVGAMILAIVQDMSHAAPILFTILTIAAMAIIVIIGIMEAFIVGQSHLQFQRSRRTTIHLAIALGGMIARLFVGPSVGPIGYIRGLAGWAALPVIRRTINRLQDPVSVSRESITSS